ncbi:ATPase [Peribacillus loiseleuriae]|uniref:ATPase n=1 Tax=Peribacillus loiseleuriae TaxID=1679170 RepID=UPI003829EE97
MKNKLFRLPLIAAFGTMLFLYLIGDIFSVSFLEFKIFQNKQLENGLTQTTEVALLPIVIGLVIGFVVERILKLRENE